MSDLNFDSIQQALNRIAPYINHTPIFSSQKLNELLKNTILFKMENQQKANSFKARGAFNAVLAYREKFGFFPKKGPPDAVNMIFSIGLFCSPTRH